MFAVFAFKIKVSIILKIIQWNYQLKNQNWAVYELGTVLLFKRFWLKNLPLDPKSYRSFRETGPWPWNSHFVFFFPFTVFVAFIPALPSARVALNYFRLWNPLKRNANTLKWPSSYVRLPYACFTFDVKGTTYLDKRQHILKHIKRAFIPCFSSVWHGRKRTVEGLQKSQTLRKSKMVSVTSEHKQRRQHEKVKKTICLINKTTTLHVQDTFLYISLRHCTATTWNVCLFFFLILDTVR